MNGIYDSQKYLSLSAFQRDNLKTVFFKMFHVYFSII